MLNFVKSKKEYLIIIGVVILIMSPLFSNNYVIGDDTRFHISNVFARYTALLHGDILFQKILPIIANDLGYGTGIFYPPLAHAFTAIISFVCAGNIILSLKILHFIVYIVSSIMMYKLVNRVFKNKYVALISAIFYITFPYITIDVFSRSAIAETLMFMFMPMIVLGLYELFNGDERLFYFWFIIGYTGMINSHLVLSVYFTALIMIYLIVNIKKVFTKEKFKALLISSLLILLINAFFLVPIVEHKMINTYEVFEGTNMASSYSLELSTLELKEFIIQKHSEQYLTVSYYLNLLALVMALVTIIDNKKLLKEKSQRNFFVFLVVLIIFLLILITGIFPWAIAPKMMLMLQFVWRLETILILALSILAAIALMNVKKTKTKIIFLIIIVLFNLWTVNNLMNPEKMEVYNIDNIDVSYYGLGWSSEYLPKVTVSNMENRIYFKNRTQDIIVKQGSAKIQIKENNTPTLKATIQNCESETVIELPRIYYLGYELSLTNDKGKQYKLDLYMNDNGFIETKINENGILQLEYTGTIVAQIANIISAITILGCVSGYIYFVKIKPRKRLMISN